MCVCVRVCVVVLGKGWNDKMGVHVVAAIIYKYHIYIHCIHIIKILG